MAPAGADRRRAPGPRRRDAERPHDGRLGRGEREHGPRRLRAARGAGIDRHQPRAWQLRRRGRGRLARGRADRRRGDRVRSRRRRRPPRRGDHHPRVRRSPRSTRRRAAAGVRAAAGSRSGRTRRRAGARRLVAPDGRGRGAARAPPSDRAAGGRARRVPARPAAAPACVPARRAPDRRRRPARADPGRAAQPARRGAGVGATAVAARAPGPRGPRRHGRRSRRAPVGGRLERRHRRGGLRHLGGRTTDGTARRVDELVADQGLGRMPVTRAAGGGGS